jgi:hypothetical protein
MELFGREGANEFYNKLGPDQQTAVLDFLARGTYSRPKAELMLEVAEELKTRLLAGGMTRIGGKTNPDIAELILKLPDEDLVEAVVALSGDDLARFLLYFDAAHLGHLFLLLMRKSGETFAKAGRALGRLAEIGDAPNLDEPVKQVLLRRVDKVASDRERPYLTFYKALIEASGDDAQDALVDHLSRGSIRVRNYLSESVVTFGTFFKLHGDYQELILDRLSMTDIGILLSGLEEAQISTVRSLLDQKRLDLVDEETTRIKGRPPFEQMQAFETARKRVIGHIKALKGNGPLTNMLATKPPELIGDGTDSAARPAA